jgi:hypothetical protein
MAFNSELQSLNTALSALGLPQSDIAVIDRIAALLKDFSPAYSDLLHQFETLAQSQLAPTAATPPSTTSARQCGVYSRSDQRRERVVCAPCCRVHPGRTAFVATNKPAYREPRFRVESIGEFRPKGSSAAGATFQVRDLVIRFASVSETQTNNTSRTPGSPQSATNSKTTSRDRSTSASQVNVLHLGVEEISVTLHNSLGQRAHVHVTRSGSKTNSTSGALDSGTFLAKSANA